MHASQYLFVVIGMMVAAIAPAQSVESAALVAPFSAAKPGTTLPKGWIPLSLGSHKQPTAYNFVEDGGQLVLHAHAEAAASALLHPVNFDIRSAPVLQWRWKISQVIADADNKVASREDSPARITLGFDGDRSRLTLKEKTASVLAKTASGRDLPYAQLVYVWSTAAPVGTVIANPHTKRVQMVVAVSGSANAGKWVTLSRNVHDDFKRAFGEEPGALTDVGVLTDTDNTGATVDAWYGDIRFVPATN